MGEGTEEESIFNPVNFDAFQWVNAVKSAGMKGLAGRESGALHYA